MVFLILQKSMGGVASRLQGGEGARRLEESGEEVKLVAFILFCAFSLYCTHFCCIGTWPSFQLGNPLGRGTKRRREVEDDIKVTHWYLVLNQYAGSVEKVDLTLFFSIYLANTWVNYCIFKRQEVWRILTNCCPPQRRKSSPLPVNTSTGISSRLGLSSHLQASSNRFKIFFQAGRDSDVTLLALGRSVH